MCVFVGRGGGGLFEKPGNMLIRVRDTTVITCWYRSSTWETTKEREGQKSPLLGYAGGPMM